MNIVIVMVISLPQLDELGMKLTSIMMVDSGESNGYYSQMTV